MVNLRKGNFIFQNIPKKRDWGNLSKLIKNHCFYKLNPILYVDISQNRPLPNLNDRQGLINPSPARHRRLRPQMSKPNENLESVIS